MVLVVMLVIMVDSAGNGTVVVNIVSGGSGSGVVDGSGGNEGIESYSFTK